MDEVCVNGIMVSRTEAKVWEAIQRTAKHDVSDVAEVTELTEYATLMALSALLARGVIRRCEDQGHLRFTLQ